MAVPTITSDVRLLLRLCRHAGRRLHDASLGDPVFARLKSSDAIRRPVRPFDPTDGGQAAPAGPRAFDSTALFGPDLVGTPASARDDASTIAASPWRITPWGLGFRQFSFRHPRLALTRPEYDGFDRLGLFPTCYGPPPVSRLQPDGRGKSGTSDGNIGSGHRFAHAA